MSIKTARIATLGLLALLVVTVRLRLLDMPLERDEGEYAYAGQMILQGVLPYGEVFNMKLPGTYAAYAAIMAVFGQTPSGIHFGLLLVNLVSLALIYLIGRLLLGEVGALVSTVAFACLSSSPHILGLQGHATHFVTLFAVGGIYTLLLATPNPLPKRSSWLAFFSGCLFGLAFLMKQQGVFFGIFGIGWLGWRFWLGPRLATRGSVPAPAIPWAVPVLFGAGLLLPYLMTCVVFALAGLFPQFWFWTVTYASEYATALPLSEAPGMLRQGLAAVAGPNLLFWLLPCAGLVVMWWDKHLSPGIRFLLVTLLLLSFASVSAGFYFRQHYFITLLPSLALLTGVAVGFGISFLKKDQGLVMFVLVIVALVVALVSNGHIWFSLSPESAMRQVYGTTLFEETRKVGLQLRSSLPPDARLAVLGSEPQIYFYARRKAATGYIYMYPLMEKHEFAGRMRKELVSGIEKNQPAAVVLVGDNFSWLATKEGYEEIDQWWQSYWPSRLQLSATLQAQSTREETLLPGFRRDNTAEQQVATSQILVFSR